ncbi:MAG: hypothetical protein KGQ26_00395 [Rhodospirillales bacterium]|nr:hypothetical protein [Rhodospirillales bacterium]MDE2318394.1 hypothetical protein [Rhodospirillales bacterium]
MDNFKNCLAFVLQAEGGYSDNPADPGNWTTGVVGGGALHGTKCGISAAAYPALDIRNLTEQQIQDLYRQDFFVPIRGDDLPLPLAMAAFDAAVNAGVRRSITWLQQSAEVVADGILGDTTLKALNRGNALTLANDALARRLDYYAGLPGWTKFGLGWARRILTLAQIIHR